MKIVKRTVELTTVCDGCGKLLDRAYAKRAESVIQETIVWRQLVDDHGNIMFYCCKKCSKKHVTSLVSV